MTDVIGTAARRLAGIFLQAGRSRRVCQILGLLLIVGFASAARADEPIFGFTYTTDTLPKGKFEITQWSTTRFGTLWGNFWSQENKTELEYGLTNKLQLSLYGIYDENSSFRNGPFHATSPSEPFSIDVPDANSRYHNARYIGTALEALYRLRSPYTHSVGVAVYLEPVIGADFQELEGRLILQKDFDNDLVVLGCNLEYAPEWRQIPVSSPKLYDSTATSRQTFEETDANLNLAASYRFRPNWSVAIEGLNIREFNSYTLHRQINNGYYAGPSIHYGGRHFYATASLLRQLPWATHNVATVPGAVVGGYDIDNDYELYRLRVKVGWYFDGNPWSWMHRRRK